MKKTLSSPVLYPNGTCGIGASPFPGFLLSWRQESVFCGFFGV